MANAENITRRPLKSRDTRWAAAITRQLIRIGLRPNTISLLSIVFSCLAGASFWFAGKVIEPWQWSILMVAAAAGMQLRLLCNLFDGMVAVEGGFKSKSGEIYNELPDRISDALIFIGVAYSMRESAWTLTLGWTAAVLALITSYVRALAVSAGTSQLFIGPMAKPHRMAAMTAACLIAALVPLWPQVRHVLPIALGIICVGCVITIFRRTHRAIRELEAR